MNANLSIVLSIDLSTEASAQVKVFKKIEAL